MKILHGSGIRDWDTRETKSVYWAGAHHALLRARRLQGCKTAPIGPVLMTASNEAYDHYWAAASRVGGMAPIEPETLSETGLAWYTRAGVDALDDILDALPDSVVEHRPGGLRALQNLRRTYKKTNSDLADAYARRVGLMK